MVPIVWAGPEKKGDDLYKTSMYGTGICPLSREFPIPNRDRARAEELSCLQQIADPKSTWKVAASLKPGYFGYCPQAG